MERQYISLTMISAKVLFISFLIAFVSFTIYNCSVTFLCKTVVILFMICFSLISFLTGFFSLLYAHKGNADMRYINGPSNPLDKIAFDGGLPQIVKASMRPKAAQTSHDNRVTGSDIIDGSLHEILMYIIRDYVTVWYGSITNDEDFTQKAIRRSAQRVAVSVSNRAKSVDWIPYLTMRLVDDAATHLRLFKQARRKLHQEKSQSPRMSPRRAASRPPSSHKRNKSETDAMRNLVKRESSFYNPDVRQPTLESVFFDLEYRMERNRVRRDEICTNPAREQEFLSELAEFLLYFLLPDEDFDCKSLRFFLREVIVNCVVVPLIDTLSDPDYINQLFILLCARNVPSTDGFLTALRITDNSDELRYTKELVSKEIQLLRSRDSGGECDLNIKLQLGSLFYVLKMIDSRLLKIESARDAPDAYTDYINIKPIDLPLEVILKNSVALSYFIDYVSSTSKQAYIFFYLNIEGWRVSVYQQLSDLVNHKAENTASILENIRSTAMSIYEQYIGEKSAYKLDVNPGLVHKLFFRIRNINEEPSETWFDDVQRAILDLLQTHEDFLPGFMKHKSYLKMLEELDLVQQNTSEEEIFGLDMYYKNDALNVDALSKYDLLLNIDGVERGGKHARSLSDVPYLKIGLDQESLLSAGNETNIGGNKREDEEDQEVILRSSDFILVVKIIETGIVCEKGKTFGIYATQVSRQYDSGFLEEWHIYRRYSDFYDLQHKIREKFADLSKIPFPGKKTFHNMDRNVLERRMKMLGDYMHQVTQSHILSSHTGLKDLLMTFLEQGEYDRVTSGGPIASTIGSIKSGMKTIKNMPEQLMHTVDEVVEKVFHPKSAFHQATASHEASKVGAFLDIDNNENIPLRIMLLLADEVFDLKSRNQWLRRHIVTILRQIVRTMFGDIVNRRILDYVEIMTSPKNVAHYLHTFKQAFWPNGVKADAKQQRDEATKYRTRVAAKVALLSCLTDELKHIIGSDTTRKGLLTVFELFQRPVLNRRLLYVLLEGILSKLFPDKDNSINAIFEKLYMRRKSTADTTTESSAKSEKVS